ncbi:hypothetical protein AVEN_198760-1 [Araneus ventricosus]|uniref:Uncharacterized protein n=1 Tax=Araneus ventricosus TaxID=182803 RepID=A0A4Y2KJE5_ARAVE|nr:hypothetical protein AVEN_198760-1 [Araneus ventricosus]
MEKSEETQRVNQGELWVRAKEKKGKSPSEMAVRKTRAGGNVALAPLNSKGENVAFPLPSNLSAVRSGQILRLSRATHFAAPTCVSFTC